MPEHERVIAVVREWVVKAENDLKNAAHTVKMDEECPTDTVCFHAQQCVEKYLKAFLVFKGIDFPKSHDVGRVVLLLPEEVQLKLTHEEQRRLTGYATFIRYPGDYEPISLREAKDAIRIARRVRSQIRKFLPRNAIQQKRK